MEGKVLVFGINDPEILINIKKAMLIQNIETIAVQRPDYGKTIGVLAGIPGPAGEVYWGPELPEPMIVLCMPQSRLDGVLAALRGMPPMAKAMLTPTNAGWKPVELLAELQREREEFRRMQKRQ